MQPKRSLPVPQIAEGKTVVCLGTGPSFNLEDVETARQKGFLLFGCNLTYESVPDLSVLYAVNQAFWDHYWTRGLEHHTASKWTTTVGAACQYGLNWIAERNRPGLSDNPEYVHHGHGSGYTLVNLAYLMGAKRIVLSGYDLKYAPDYDGRARQVGSSPRHYFGEYPHSMQHWPSVQVKGGVHVELVDLYRSIAEARYKTEFINATPGSAIDCFDFKAMADI